MQEFLDWLSQSDNAWITQIFLVVLATVTINFLIRKAFSAIQARVLRTRNVWDDAIVNAAKRPVLLFVWVIGLSVAAEIIEAATAGELFQMAPLARRLAIIALLMMFLAHFIRNVEQNILDRKKKNEVEADEISVRVIARLLRISVIITGTLVGLQTLGISVSGVLAFGGIGGLAVGFAAKDLLANFFGGLMIYLDRPFTVGDWIRSPDREIEGIVEDIGWRLTRIRTFDKRPLYIPNATFTTISLENPSRMENRRIYETFGLRYCDAGKIREILQDVKNMIRDHPEIESGKLQMVNFNALSASSLDFFIYAFTRTRDWAEYHEVKQDVLLKTIDIIHAHGADIAFPTRTLEGLDNLAERTDARNEESDRGKNYSRQDAKIAKGKIDNP